MITPPKEGKGRPSILSQPLPNDVLIALKYRSEGLSWKKAAEKEPEIRKHHWLNYTSTLEVAVLRVDLSKYK